jgi:hypothetical protein
MAKGKRIPEFKKIKAEIHKAKKKLRKSVTQPTAGKKQSATAKKKSKKAQTLLGKLKGAYLKLGNIEPF